jgi:hypothetical protein
MQEETEEIEETQFQNEAAPEVFENEAAPETPEERDERLKREDYIRRNAQAVKDREDILRRNGVIAPDEILTMDAEAALRQRCCF